MNLYILYGATVVINLLSLVLAIWLGLFLVSRSPRYLVAWLTALTLWFTGLMFLNVLLALNPPPVITLKWAWLQLLFPFWPQDTLTGTNNNWLQGWSIVPALALWHHVTVLLLPGQLTTWRWVRIFSVYLLALVAILVQANSQILFTAGSINPLYLNSLRAGPWYPIFAAALVLLTSTSVYNLSIGARKATSSIARKQLQVLTWVSLVAGLAGLVFIAGSYLTIPIPVLVTSSLVGVTVVLIGWSVARYSALMEGRTIQKDFVYSLFLLGLILLIYIPISWILIKTYHAPMAILAVFPALAVITHFSMAAIYKLMDRFLLTRETRQLRIQLRELWRTVGVDGTLEARLEPSLEVLCHSVEASYALIMVFNSNTCKKLASYRKNVDIPDIDIQKISADDLVNLQNNYLSSPLDDASLLVPLYGDGDQLGVLLLGQPNNGLHYAPEDVDQILEFSDHVGETIHISRRNSEYLAQIAELVQVHITPEPKRDAPVSVEYLEHALRNLNDYACLADNPLVGLKLVQSRLPQGEITHLERGKAVRTVILEGLEKLHPGDGVPGKPPPSEWHAYLILQDAYLNETSNRDISQKLYISEGTFNRTRRAAIRSLTRALAEMEANAS